MLTQLRRAQATAALNQAILLQPRMTLAHARLASLYLEMGYLDLALEHQRAAGLNESAEALEAEVRRRKDLYEANRSFLKVADQARAALDKGLAATALQVLLEADVSAFGAEGMLLELELLLATGRVDEVRNWMAENQKPFLQRLQLRLVTGAHAGSDGRLRRCGREPGVASRAGSYPWGRGRPSVEMRERHGSVAGRPDRQRAVAGRLQSRARSTATVAIVPAARLRHRRALGSESDIAVLRGLLALESGEHGPGDRALPRSAWDLGRWHGGRPGRIDFPGRPAAQTCLDWLTPPRKKDLP